MPVYIFYNYKYFTHHFIQSYKRQEYKNKERKKRGQIVKTRKVQPHAKNEIESESMQAQIPLLKTHF